jgi:hypothetical protein
MPRYGSTPSAPTSHEPMNLSSRRCSGTRRSVPSSLRYCAASCSTLTAQRRPAYCASNVRTSSLRVSCCPKRSAFGSMSVCSFGSNATVRNSVTTSHTTKSISSDTDDGRVSVRRTLTACIEPGATEKTPGENAIVQNGDDTSGIVTSIASVPSLAISNESDSGRCTGASSPAARPKSRCSFDTRSFGQRGSRRPSERRGGGLAKRCSSSLAASTRKSAIGVAGAPNALVESGFCCTSATPCDCRRAPSVDVRAASPPVVERVLESDAVSRIALSSGCRSAGQSFPSAAARRVASASVSSRRSSSA